MIVQGVLVYRLKGRRRKLALTPHDKRHNKQSYPPYRSKKLISERRTQYRNKSRLQLKVKLYTNLEKTLIHVVVIF